MYIYIYIYIYISVAILAQGSSHPLARPHCRANCGALLLLVTTAAREAAWHRRERATRQEDRLFVRLAKAAGNLQAHHGSDLGWLGGSQARHPGMGFPTWWQYSARYSPQAGPHKPSDGSYWICRGKGSCGYQWNWWDKDRCHRCNVLWAGSTPGTREPAAKEEAADTWAVHTAVAAVAAAVRGSAATTTTAAATAGAGAVVPDDAAAAVQEDSDDIEGMEKIVEQLRGMGFTEGSPGHDELSRKVEEARGRRIAARPLWAQERDLRGNITRKQQQISRLREKRSDAAKESAKASLQSAEALDQKVVESATEVGVLQRQLAEVAKGVLLAAPCMGDASRLPPELQKLPKGLLDMPEWQAKLKACEDGLAELVQQAQGAAEALEQQAVEATSLAALAAAAAVAGLAAGQGAEVGDDDEDMAELGEQEVVDALGDFLPSSAGGGENDDEGAFAARKQEAAKKLLHLMAGRTVSARRPRKFIGKKAGG